MFNIKSLARMAICTALIVVCSWLTVPFTVPFTMQTFAIFFTVCLLGPWQGMISILVYILLGAVGVPVFSGFRGGLDALLGPTGGYILGFLATAPITGLMMGDGKLRRLIPAMVLGLFGLLCFRHRVVYGGLYQKHRGHRPLDGAGLVRVPVYPAGRGENGPGGAGGPAAEADFA